MENKITTTSAIILGLVLLGIGFFVGYSLKPGKPAPKVEPQTCPSCLLDSKLTSNWSGFAIGQVKEISGRDLTLISNGETLKVSILDGARIQLLSEEGPKETSFGDIKTGGKVEIQFIVLSEGNRLIGSVITILP